MAEPPTVDYECDRGAIRSIIALKVEIKMFETSKKPLRKTDADLKAERGSEPGLGAVVIYALCVIGFITAAGWIREWLVGLNTIGDLINVVSSSYLGALALSIAVIVVPVYLLKKRRPK
jgi:hypothetical protein